MTGFEERLRKAIDRGHRRAESQQQQREQEALSEDELKRLHSSLRLTLSEHIEECVGGLPQHFPGFQFQTIFGERGWGAACSRDDLRVSSRRRENDYSRLEMMVRPFSASSGVLDLAAKGTIRNKEVYNRTYFERLQDVDVDKFLGLIDAWVLEYAEIYAAKS